ncbi:hypothetical protein K488DRAFT_86887 [Vararia minispora EC-137]|uniref:Uncharacterized protein n=1 Tax=Vararia minispora EC-137 TaxID=1314806 RepID=A0ACB8QI23_9AGAM|nr:hypothetical protein K488DRAFT_86887 [Vararia minispora EC-137]
MPNTRLNSHRSNAGSVHGPDEEAHDASDQMLDTDERTFDTPFPKPHVAHRWLREMTLQTGDFPRYSRRAIIPKELNTIQRYPLDSEYPHWADKDPEDMYPWIPATHPEGQLYFYHADRPIYTEAYLYQKAFRGEIADLLEYLDACIEWFVQRDGENPLGGNRELVVEVGDVDVILPDGTTPINWKYYIVDHDSKSLLWLRNHDVTAYVREYVHGAWSPSHYHYLTQSWYWLHCTFFPTGHRAPLDKEEIRRLAGLLDYAILDGMMSATSTNNFTADELRWMNDIVQHAEKQSEDERGITPELLAAVARMHSWIARWRFINFHGQRGVRLDVRQSVHQVDSQKRKRTLFIRILVLPLFLAPQQYLMELEDIYVDATISLPSWHRYFKKLLDEWDRLATVILTANVSFLAIPDVLQFPNNSPSESPTNNIQPFPPPLRSGPAILSYLSTIVVLGSIMIGLLLARQNRAQTETSTDAAQAQKYLSRQESRFFGFEPLVVLYSLPYALLIWATGLFLAALLYFALLTHDRLTIIVVAAGAGVVSMAIAWCAFAGTRPPEPVQEWTKWAYGSSMKKAEQVGEVFDVFKKHVSVSWAPVQRRIE